MFEVEVPACPHCEGVRRLLAAIHDPASIERVLRAMGLPHESPEVAKVRTPGLQGTRRRVDGRLLEADRRAGGVRVVRTAA